jgi:hypothetical protein
MRDHPLVRGYDSLDKPVRNVILPTILQQDPRNVTLSGAGHPFMNTGVAQRATAAPSRCDREREKVAFLGHTSVAVTLAGTCDSLPWFGFCR